LTNAIKYLQQHEIDKTRWDQCVSASPNGFLYSRSFFLDALCEWDALIAGDYDFLMPLPFKRKWGIQYIYTPFFTGQLGIISPNEVSSLLVREFLQAIPSSFQYIDLQLNEQNDAGNIPDAIVTKRNNYVLPLSLPYHSIEKDFSRDGKKNLRQSRQYGLIAEEQIEIDTVVQYFREAYGKLNPQIKEEVYTKFAKACRQSISEGLGFTIGVKNQGNELVATAFIGKDDKRLYYIMGAPSVAGRKINAQHFLIDEIIKKYAGSALSLDFEGSDIPAVASFYKKFSPQLNIYQQVKINRLPMPLRWLKK
jgi:hypothetical protein